MGLFSGSSKTYVSTVTYPMGSDDPADRTDFAQYVVLNSILQNKNIAEALTQSMLHSRGMQLRNVYKYARDSYYYGVPFSNFDYLESPDQDLISSVLATANAPADVLLVNCSVTKADFVYWGEEYLARTYGYDRLLGLFLKPPKGVEQDATISYDIDLYGTIQILLINSDSTSRLITYLPIDMLSRKTYLHAIYRLVNAFPTKTSQESHITIAGEESTVSTTVSIVDTAGETTEKTTVVTTTVADGTTSVVSSVQVRVLSRPQYMFYRLGTGTYPEFDAWLQSSELDSPFFPSVPLRIDNKDVSTTSAAKQTELYKTGKKLLDKIGANFDEVAEKINENPKVSEIDFAYVQFGIALNSKTPECKRYIYRFMESLLSLSFYSHSQTEEWIAEYNATLAELQDNGLANEDGSGPGSGGHVPAFQTKPRGFVTPPTNRLRVSDRDGTDEKHALDIELQWQYIDKSVHDGLVSVDARIGDCTVAMSGERTEFHMLYDFTVDNSTLVVRRQLTENTYEEMQIGGLVYFNHVYKDKAVAISAWDALNTADEEGFILPLSQDIMRDMSLLEVTQMSADCMFITLNCYQIVKKKWYQTGFFAILMIIVAIILLVVSWGASAPASSSMIGMALSALAAAGVAATIALIIVATLTVLVGMVISMLLTPVLSDVFGETWGPVIATIISALAMNYAATGNLAASTTQFTQLTAANIIKGSIAVVDAYGHKLVGDTMEVNDQIQALQTEEQQRLEEIKKLTEQNLGTHTDAIDIQGFITSTGISVESVSSFLSRTLMTGSDVAKVTRGLVEDFVEVGLYLPTTS